MNDKVSIMEAVNKVMDYTGLDNVNEIPVLIDWAIEADRSIGSFYDWEKKIHILDVVGCRADLPPGVVWVRGIVMGDAGCDCEASFDFAYDNLDLIDKSTGLETTTGFLTIDLSSSEDIKCSNVRWEVQDNSIILSSDNDGAKVTVQVLQYQLDTNGFPKVNTNNIRAIATYLEYRLMKRSRWSKNRAEKMDHTDIAETYREWNRLCADARATTSRMSETEESDVVGIMNDPLSGVGMALPSTYYQYYDY